METLDKRLTSSHEARAAITIVLMLIAAFGLFLHNPNRDWLLSFLIVPILISNLFLRKRTTLLVILTSLAGATGLAIFYIGKPWEVYVSELVLLGAVGFLTLISPPYSKQNLNTVPPPPQTMNNEAQLQQYAQLLEARIAERTAELESIHRITEKLLSTEDISLIQETVIENLVKLLDLNLATIALYIENESIFTSSALYPKWPKNIQKLLNIMDIANYKVPYKAGVNRFLDQLVQEGQAFMTAKLAEIASPYIPRMIAETTQRYYRTRIYMGLPLVIENRTIGLLLVGTQRPTIRDEERAALELIAGQTAVAISRARHYEAAQKRAAELAEAMAQMAYEIEERKQTQARLAASLQEKEVLLREIYHRVKNNLQVVSSLINLQSLQVTDKAAQEVFKQMRTRVNIMALVHEKLYRSTNLAKIDFSEYLTSLTHELFRAYLDYTQEVQLTLKVEPIWLGLDTAIPCGLILHELIANSLKHAFPAGRTVPAPALTVSLQIAGRDHYNLTVRDNGVGFTTDMDWRNAGSLGLQLITSLTEQIGGTVEIENNHGTAVTINFSEVRYKKRG